MDAVEAIEDLGAEGPPGPPGPLKKVARRRPSKDATEGVFQYKREQLAFARLVLVGVGIAFVVSVGAYLTLIYWACDKEASPFATLLTGVIPTLTGTISGYILHSKSKA
jgi:hypothetical protein